MVTLIFYKHDVHLLKLCRKQDGFYYMGLSLDNNHQTSSRRWCSANKLVIQKSFPRVALRSISQALGHVLQLCPSVHRKEHWLFLPSTSFSGFSDQKSGHSSVLLALLWFSWVAVYRQSKGKPGEFLIEASSSGSPVCVPGLLVKITKISIYPPRNFMGIDEHF